jgi:transcriptional regulator with XRE-family HTH domain
MDEKDAIWLGKFTRHLVKLMEVKSMSQRRLATLSGISLGKIHKIVHNRANMNITTLRKLAEGLDIPAKLLLDFEEEQ